MIEAAKKFLQTLDSNEEARNILSSAIKGVDEEKEAELLADAAKKTGFDVETDDIRQVMNSLKQKADDALNGIREISSEQMEKVAGGGSCDGFFLPGCDGFFAHEECNLGAVV